jgi:uncharacterized membrane protein
MATTLFCENTHALLSNVSDLYVMESMINSSCRFDMKVNQVFSRSGGVFGVTLSSVILWVAFVAIVLVPSVSAQNRIRTYKQWSGHLGLEGALFLINDTIVTGAQDKYVS